MMLLTEFLNASVGSIGVLLGTSVGFFLVKYECLEIVVVGSRPEVSETANLMSEVGDHLGADIPPVIGAGTGAE